MTENRNIKRDGNRIIGWFASILAALVLMISFLLSFSLLQPGINVFFDSWEIETQIEQGKPAEKVIKEVLDKVCHNDNDSEKVDIRLPFPFNKIADFFSWAPDTFDRVFVPIAPYVIGALILGFILAYYLEKRFGGTVIEVTPVAMALVFCIVSFVVTIALSPKEIDPFKEYEKYECYVLKKRYGKLLKNGKEGSWQLKCRIGSFHTIEKSYFGYGFRLNCSNV